MARLFTNQSDFFYLIKALIASIGLNSANVIHDRIGITIFM